MESQTIASQGTDVDDRLITALSSSLRDLTAGLIDASRGADLSWLRPLVILAAEIEVEGFPCGRIDWLVVRDECYELANLLTGAAGHAESFSAPYKQALRDSDSLKDLVKQVLERCRALFAGANARAVPRT